MNRVTIQKHKVLELLSETTKFYDYLSSNIFEFGERNATRILGFDSIFLETIAQTFSSIRVTIQNGCISDSFTLLRKNYDSILVHIYLLVLREKDKKENIFFIKDKTVNNWFYSKERTLPRTTKEIIEEIGSFEKTKELWEKLNTDKRYIEIKEYCNDFTHSNFFSNIQLNSKQCTSEEYLNKVLDTLNDCLTDIVILHISYMFILKEHYMMSSDYRDCLECGMEPPENCECNVAPFIQEYLNNVLNSRRADIVAVIKNNTNMIID